MGTGEVEGTVIDGRYEVLERIARGGMATVYLAHDRRLDRDVAVKVMHPHLAESEAFIARFRREARAAARLGHPNAVAVFDQGLWGEASYLTMEYVDGEDLRDTLRREGALPVGESLDIVEQLLDALGAAHRRGLIHRDIKPENVLRATDGTPKLADFGLARAVSDATAASTGTVLGTVAYLAPELVTSGNASAASDIYAVGVMLFEMLTGRQPFAGEMPINVAFQHVTSSVPPASESIPGLPREIDDLIGALTARDPDDRLRDGDEALAAVRRTRDLLSAESAALRADVPGVPEAQLPTTSPDPEVANGPNGTTPLWVKPSTGTAAIPIGVPQEIAPTSVQRHRRRWVPLLLALVFTLVLGGGAAAYYYLAGPGAFTTVPSVRGMEWEKAADAVADWDLVPIRVEEFSDTSPSGTVLRTDPDSDESVRKNTDVQLHVSQGIEKFPFPDVVGQSQEEALAALENFGETAVIEKFSQSAPAGEVLAIAVAVNVFDPDGDSLTAGDPPAVDTLIPHTATFELVVSKGKEPVPTPDVTEKTVEDAFAELEDAGLTGVEADEREYHDTLPEGSVIAQSHVGDGTYRGDTITLTVSKGPELVEVPRVIWMNEAKAVEALRGAGLDVKVNKPFGVILNTVRTQSEAAGTWVKKGTVVEIEIV